jgi:hypothetical protein
MHQALLDYQLGIQVDTILNNHSIPKTTFWRWITKYNSERRGHHCKFSKSQAFS